MTNRTEIFKGHFFNSLRQLSDRDYQERIWANQNNPEGLVASYTEAVIGFFDDALVADALGSGAIIYDKKVTQTLHELSDAVDHLDEDNRYTMEVINDPKMQIIRDKATEALQLIEASDASENTVAFIEEGTLKVTNP